MFKKKERKENLERGWWIVKITVLFFWARLATVWTIFKAFEASKPEVGSSKNTTANMK